MSTHRTIRVLALLLGIPSLAVPCLHAAVQPVSVSEQDVSDSGFISTAVPAGDTLHLPVGRSISIHTGARLKKIYVGNPVVLNSVTQSPYDIVITAKSAGTSPLLLTDEAGRSRVYYVIADLNIEGLQRDLSQTFPNAHLRAESQEGRISVYGTVESDATAKAVMQLAGLYSKNVADSLFISPVRLQQVRLKVRIMEVDRSKLNQFGVNILSGPNNLAQSTSSQFPVTTTIDNSSGKTKFSISDPLSFLYYNFNYNVGAAIRDLEARNVLQILAEPNITTVSGQKASFLSGGEFPFPVVESTGGGFPTVAIQFRPYGVKLDFMPVVDPDGTIQLHIAPEVSALDYTNAVTISGFTVPALSTRKADTNVRLHNGQSFAISGLLDRRTTDNLSAVPGLGQLPVLGNLFRSKSINHSLVELVVVVTPTIVDPSVNQPDDQVKPAFPIPLLDPTKFDNHIPDAEKGSKK